MADTLPWLPVNGDSPTPISQIELQFLQEQLEIASANNELFKEELNDVVSRMNDAATSGWIEMTTGATQSGLQLNILKAIATRLRDMTDTNPLLKRGHQLRRDYVYARGVDFDIKPDTAKDRVVKKMDDPYNAELIFSEEGHDTLMRARYTDGNRFLMVNKKSKEIVVVPLDQISNAILDPNDPSRIRYLERNFNGSATWYSTDQYDSKASAQVKVKGKSDVKVNRDWVMIHKAFNRPPGATWGLPDALAAYLWVMAYSNYLKDNATLVKAYSAIALKVSAATKKGAAEASRQVGANRGAGGTAVTGRDVNIDTMPTSGSNVNFNNGRPLAANVATSLGVSIVALLSDPGTGGSYGVAETLDPPTLLLAQTLQKSEAEYFKRLLVVMGANNKTAVTFPSIDKDPAYRMLQSIYLGVAQGVISRKEARPLIALLLDMGNLDENDLPKPDGFNSWKDPDATAPAGSAQPGQGNAGAVAGGVDQGQTNNDERNGEVS